jgi:hypothetical protein
MDKSWVEGICPQPNFPDISGGEVLAAWSNRSSTPIKLEQVASLPTSSASGGRSFGHVFETYNATASKHASDLDYYSYTENKKSVIIDKGKGEFWSRTTLGFKCSSDKCLEHRPNMGY